eukprot:scaffold48954_cov82-Phaeocystis_antarctica.AAC.1
MSCASASPRCASESNTSSMYSVAEVVAAPAAVRGASVEVADEGRGPSAVHTRWKAAGTREYTPILAVARMPSACRASAEQRDASAAIVMRGQPAEEGRQAAVRVR